MKQSLILLVVLILVCSCSGRRSRSAGAALHRYESFVERVEANADHYSEEQLMEAADKNQRYQESLRRNRHMTNEEREELGRLEARYMAATAKQAINIAIDEMEGASHEFEGMLDEFSRILSTE